MIPFSVSRTIMKTKNLLVRFYTKIILNDNIRKNNSLYYQILTFNDKAYMIIDTKSYLQLTYTDKERVKDTGDSAYINDKNITYLLSGLKDMLKKIYSDDVFYIEDNKLAIYGGNHDISLTQLGYSSSILLSPTIIEDNMSNKDIEGISLRINTLDRECILTINEFEALIYNIKNVDFFTYSQLLLNHFISCAGKHRMLVNQVPKYNPNEYTNIYNINRKDMVMDVDIGSNFPPKKPVEDIFNQSGLK